MMCGSRRIPEWRKAAPMMSRTQTAATVSAASVVSRGPAPASMTTAGACAQLRLVKKAMLDHDAEKYLRQGRMRRGDRGRQVKQHGQPAQNALGNHRAQRAPAQNAHPSPLLHLLRPPGNGNRQQADELSQHAVSVLKLYPAHQRRNAVKGTERSRPVRHREPGVVAGHQRPGDDQQKDAARRQHGEAVVRAMIRNALSVWIFRHEVQGTRWPAGKGLILSTLYEEDDPGRAGDAAGWPRRRNFPGKAL